MSLHTDMQERDERWELASRTAARESGTGICAATGSAGRIAGSSCSAMNLALALQLYELNRR